MIYEQVEFSRKIGVESSLECLVYGLQWLRPVFKTEIHKHLESSSQIAYISMILFLDA